MRTLNSLLVVLFAFSSTLVFAQASDDSDGPRPVGSVKQTSSPRQTTRSKVEAARNELLGHTQVVKAGPLSRQKISVHGVEVNGVDLVAFRLAMKSWLESQGAIVTDVGADYKLSGQITVAYARTDTEGGSVNLGPLIGSLMGRRGRGVDLQVSSAHTKVRFSVMGSIDIVRVVPEGGVSAPAWTTNVISYSQVVGWSSQSITEESYRSFYSSGASALFRESSTEDWDMRRYALFKAFSNLCVGAVDVPEQAAKDVVDLQCGPDGLSAVVTLRQAAGVVEGNVMRILSPHFDKSGNYMGGVQIGSVKVVAKSGQVLTLEYCGQHPLTTGVGYVVEIP